MADYPTHEVHTLHVPVTVDGREYTELRVRRPRARDILRQAKSKAEPLDKIRDQLVNLCEVAPAVIDEVDISDWLALQNTLAAFGDPEEGEVRQAVVTLSIAVGWDLDTIENMTYDEIISWLKTVQSLPRPAAD